MSWTATTRPPMPAALGVHKNMAIVAIIFAGLIALTFSLRKAKAFHAWLLGCVVVPVFVLFAEFVLPYQGGGASMWSIAIVVGSVLGAISSAVGLLVAKLISNA